nr:hypothetical protein [Pseudomonas congelans]
MISDTTSLDSVSCQVVEALNEVILELQTEVSSASISTFHQQALERVRALVQFDKAWWGRSTWRDNWPVEHSSFLLGLPSGYAAEWEQLKTSDASVGRMHQTQGVCQVIHCTAADAPSALAELGRQYDLCFALGIVLTDPHTQQGVHLTLFRSADHTPFSPLDKRLIEWLMPHLGAAPTGQLSAHAHDPAGNPGCLRRDRHGGERSLRRAAFHGACILVDAGLGMA